VGILERDMRVGVEPPKEKSFTSDPGRNEGPNWGLILWEKKAVGIGVLIIKSMLRFDTQRFEVGEIGPQARRGGRWAGE